MARLIPGPRARAFARVARTEVDLERAQAVIVIDADGAAVLIATNELDRSAMTNSLVDLVFDQGQIEPMAVVPAQRQPHHFTRDNRGPDLH